MSKNVQSFCPNKVKNLYFYTTNKQTRHPKNTLSLYNDAPFLFLSHILYGFPFSCLYSKYMQCLNNKKICQRKKKSSVLYFFSIVGGNSSKSIIFTIFDIILIKY